MYPRIFALLLLPLPLFASFGPWGKDVELIQNPVAAPTAIITTPLLGPFAETLIAFHQNVISPADGPRSHFIPSSSQYTLDAMRKYGFFQGFFMGCDRLMRENNDLWVYREVIGPDGQRMKWNPVP